MRPTSNINCKADPLAEAIRQGLFLIPRHQRPYDWEKGDVKQLLEDVKMCIDVNAPEHFLGAIMLIGDPGATTWVINDGQQRLVTFSLVCAALCRQCHNRGDLLGENAMLQVLFDGADERTTLDDTMNLKPRIKIMRHEMNTYQNIISGEDVRKNGKLTPAWNEVTNFFDQDGHCSPDWQKDFMHFLLHKLTVITVTIPSSVNANTVFETLNARGKSLSQIHLLRNHVYSYFGAEDPAGERIERSMEQIELGMPNGSLGKYAHCAIQARYGYMSSAHLYRDFRAHISSNYTTHEEQRAELERFVHYFSEKQQYTIFRLLANGYAAAEDVLESIDTMRRQQHTGQRKIKAFLKDLRGYSVSHPVLFALLCRYADAQQAGIRADSVRAARLAYLGAKYHASFIQRIAHLSTSFPSSRYDKGLASLAHKIHKNDCSDASDILNALKNLDETKVIPDKNYITSMHRASTPMGKAKAKARYILARLAEDEAQEINEYHCAVEHILPASPSYLPTWDGFSQESYEECVNRLGNLALLLQGEDRPQRKHNESFSVKKREIYAKSRVAMTRDLCKIRAWNPAAVDERQRELAELAAKLWSFR